MQLYIIRHARAAERGAAYPDDSKRPLVAKGFRQAETLAKLLTRLGVELDGLYSSPYTRAVQTAEALAGLKKDGRTLRLLDELATDDYAGLLKKLQASAGEVLAIVGHEPYLSEFAAYLLTGDRDGVRLELRKAALVLLSGELILAGMRLDTVLPARIYKHL